MVVNYETVVAVEDILLEDDRDLLIRWMDRSGCVAGKSERQALLDRLGLGSGHIAIDESSASQTFATNLVFGLCRIQDTVGLCKLVELLSVTSARAAEELEPLRSRLGLPSTHATLDHESPDDQIKAQIDGIVVGLQALYDLVKTYRKAREAVRPHRSILGKLCIQIRTQHCYKMMHDQFEGLRAQFKPIDDCIRELREDPKNEQAWQELADLAASDASMFCLIVDKLLATGQNGPIEEYDAMWSSDLDMIRNDFILGIDQRSIVRIEATQNYFARLLSTVPTNLNTRLVTMAKTLPISLLVDLLRRIGDSMDAEECDPQSIRIFEGSIPILDQLCGHATDLIQSHDHLQMIDNEIKRFEMNREWDLTELDYDWPRLSRLTQPVFQNRTEGWAIDLIATVNHLDSAFEADPVDRGAVEELFRRYCDQIVDRFQEIDTRLLKLCNLLAEPESSPLRVLEQIQERVR